MFRSLLFAPGDSEKKMLKASNVGADCVILDLEDSVVESRKPIAREMVTEFLKEGGNPEVSYFVRINPLDSGKFLQDLAAVVPAGPAGIVFPKSNGVQEALAIANYIEVLEVEHGLSTGSVRLLPLVSETPTAIFTMGEYKDGPARMMGLTWGAEDLGAAVGASANLQSNKDWTSPYQMTRSLCLFAAHAAKVQAIDTVMADFRDLDRLKVVCDEGRRDGFTGKICIHPAQVEVINEAYSPSLEELDHARAVIKAFAENPEAGTLQIEGKMIDKPHLVLAERVLAFAAELSGK
ncbi:MAG: CoA ester lyase [Proteobacteria bacterium]|jgi:citrate lyase subunit beta / citryl-CoA lyase|nr:CoA ester lyase [Pseudomonadota bacterium]MBT5064930.1 CoA ester lyase [Pseudomonadota bacterium]MBT6464161.1 CoA ester lyase [Pseudomonadota bacterium]MBT6675457.1 CoA ester lyase [Pseudomonadota bacterium]MBT7247274.1 CoA ester lyase [Pseudomonadota bacterium]